MVGALDMLLVDHCYFHTACLLNVAKHSVKTGKVFKSLIYRLFLSFTVILVVDRSFT